MSLWTWPREVRNKKWRYIASCDVFFFLFSASRLLSVSKWRNEFWWLPNLQIFYSFKDEQRSNALYNRMHYAIEVQRKRERKKKEKESANVRVAWFDALMYDRWCDSNFNLLISCALNTNDRKKKKYAFT